MAICDATMLERIVSPPETTAAAVSSHDDFIPKMILLCAGQKICLESRCARVRNDYGSIAVRAAFPCAALCAKAFGARGRRAYRFRSRCIYELRRSRFPSQADSRG